MKQKVKFSAYSLIVTSVVLILFVVGIFLLLGKEEKITLFCIIMGIAIIAGLYFCPKYIEANESGIVLHRLLSPSKVFLYDMIQPVETCYPSAGGLRLCASGGFFGYWGYFNDIMIGSYFGYYGNRNNCILIKLKDGKQYVLGCENASAITNYITSQLTKLHKSSSQ